MTVDRSSLYCTELGAAYVADSLEFLENIDTATVDLVITSPPFALRRQKTYGNVTEGEYVEWLKPFAKQVLRVLKESGSFVLDLGGAYHARVPSRSLYNFRVLISLCDEVGFHLAEDFYWHNPAKLPSPIEWVNKRKIRAKDSVDTIWWLSKSEWPKANVGNVLKPYSDRMKSLIANPDTFYSPKKRPSGHDIGANFGKDNGGAIPSNLLEISNTDSNSPYLKLCKKFGLERHPARFPAELPRFFINMLTEPGDLVLDIFAGSNTTGVVAEELRRRWIAIDNCHDYLRTSVLRFIHNQESSYIEKILSQLMDPQSATAITGQLV